MAIITQIANFTGTSPNGQVVIDSSGNVLGTMEESGISGNDGTVFEVANTGSGFANTPTTVASFDGSDGSSPVGGLIADASGDLFGATDGGGASDDGAIFEIVKTTDGYTGVPTLLASFDGTDGAHPTADLVMDAAGNLFGTTDNRSTDGIDTVFELTKTADGYASALTTLAEFTNTSLTSPLFVDAEGNLFGTTAQGGFPGGGTVFEIAKTADGYAAPVTVATLGSADGSPGGSLVTDAAGNIFGMTELGGANGSGEIFEIVKTNDGYADTATVLASFPRENNAGGALLIDGAGDLFAQRLPSGGAVGGELYELPKTDGVYTNTLIAVTSLDGGGPSPQLGLVADSAGNLFGTSSGSELMQNSPPNGSIYEITNTGFVPVMASTGETLGANDTPNQVLTGTPLNDTFFAGHSSVVMTGNGGADTFVFQFQPWNAGQITDFTPGNDTLDLSALLTSIGYTGHDPVGDGVVIFQSDGQGDTQVLFHDPANAWPTLVTTLDGVSPTGLTSGNTLGDGGSSGGGGTTGVTLTANDTPGQHLIGTPNDDTFLAGHSSVVMTGNGGADTFVFQFEPWAAGQITDFTPGNDKLDLSALLSAAGYTGSDPVADGYVNFQSDGNGDTNVYFDPHDSSQAFPTLVTTLDGVSPSELTTANTLGTAGSSSGGGSGGGTTGETLTANDTAGQQLTGTPNNDTFLAGHNSVIMTGNGGADQFVFQFLPWNAGSITDFNTAADVLNLKAIFATIGYTGSNPVADGYLAFHADGQGDTQVIVNPQGASTQIPITVTTLDHVDPSMIHSGDYLFA